MGIINVTPDSFSDGGENYDLDTALRHGVEQAKAGAAIIDVGGESTRPGAVPVSVEEELKRVIPVVTGLKERTSAVISIDTRHPEVALRALEAGAAIVNDIEGLRNPDMIEVVRGMSAGAVIMHMRGEPANMQDAPVYTDVVREVYVWLQERVEAATAVGIPPEALAIDPGIGFGKLAEHNIALLAKLKQFTAMGHPLVTGVSRKTIIGEITGAEVSDRLAGSLAAMTWCVWNGASILRVHDVPESVPPSRWPTPWPRTPHRHENIYRFRRCPLRDRPRA